LFVDHGATHAIKKIVESSTLCHRHLCRHYFFS
jgi:hypothetical protein